MDMATTSKRRRVGPGGNVEIFVRRVGGDHQQAITLNVDANVFVHVFEGLVRGALGPWNKFQEWPESMLLIYDGKVLQDGRLSDYGINKELRGPLIRLYDLWDMTDW